MLLNRILFVVIFYFMITSCKKNDCPSAQEIYNSATSVNIPDNDKKNFAFSNINKITFMLNDTSVISFNITNINLSYVRGNGDIYADDPCSRYSYKYENNNYEYKSSSSILPGIRMLIKTTADQNTNTPTSFSSFDIIMCNHYLPNGSVDEIFSLSGGTGSEFNLNKFTKIDTIRTSFDSVYLDLYKMNLLKNTGSGYYSYDIIYFSTTKGIVKIIDSNNNKFELIKTE